MIPCCKLCYDKYVNKDGTIDQQRYNLAHKKHLEWLKNNNRKIREEDFSKSVCTCDCHRDGIELMH